MAADGHFLFYPREQVYVLQLDADPYDSYRFTVADGYRGQRRGRARIGPLRVTGGGDLPGSEKSRMHPPMEQGTFPFAGGSGAGVSVQPVGFLVVSGEEVRMLPAQPLTVADRMVELLPGVVEDMKHIFDKDKKSAQTQGEG